MPQWRRALQALRPPSPQPTVAKKAHLSFKKAVLLALPIPLSQGLNQATRPSQASPLRKSSHCQPRLLPSLPWCAWLGSA